MALHKVATFAALIIVCSSAVLPWYALVNIVSIRRSLGGSVDELQATPVGSGGALTASAASASACSGEKVSSGHLSRFMLANGSGCESSGAGTRTREDIRSGLKEAKDAASSGACV